MLDAMYIGRRIVAIHSPVFTRTFIITLLKQIYIFHIETDLKASDSI